MEPITKYIGPVIVALVVGITGWNISTTQNQSVQVAILTEKVTALAIKIDALASINSVVATQSVIIKDLQRRIDKLEDADPRN